LSKIIALCTNIDKLNGNKIFDKDYAKNFPGALWCYYLKESLAKENIEVMTGDLALEGVKDGRYKPEDVYVIQELENLHSDELLKAGAKALLLTCFESPLYAWRFYDKIPELAEIYPNRLLFAGSFDNAKLKTGTNYIMRFPNFEQGDIINLVKPWNERKFAVLVASNKFVKRRVFYLGFKKDKYLKRLMQLTSKSFSDALKNQFQTKRLQAIEYFAKRKSLDIFGEGWGKLNRLPLIWHFRLRGILKELNPQTCEDKIKTMSDYKFAICFENTSYPGYFTEKIIDCFCAGTIPIYLGAEDIEKFIPEETFIDMRDFKNFSELNKFLQSLSEDESLKIISAGRDFLNSNNGKLHSFQGFAKRVEDIARRELNEIQA